MRLDGPVILERRTLVAVGVTEGCLRSLSKRLVGRDLGKYSGRGGGGERPKLVHPTKDGEPACYS